MKPLSPREHQVMEMIIQGLTQKEISRALSLSRQTVYCYMYKAQKKTGCKTVMSAIAYLVAGGHVLVNSA